MRRTAERLLPSRWQTRSDRRELRLAHQQPLVLDALVDDLELGVAVGALAHLPVFSMGSRTAKMTPSPDEKALHDAFWERGCDISRAFEQALARAELPHTRFHDLRHSAATFLSQGFGLEDVKNLLGHWTIVLTSNTYGHVLEQRQQEIARGMDVVLGG